MVDVDPRAVAQYAAQHATAVVRQELNNIAVHHILSNEFPDIYADVTLTGALGHRLSQLKTAALQQGAPHNDAELLRQAGREFREKYIHPAPAEPQHMRETAPVQDAPRSLRDTPSSGNRPESASTYVDPEQENRSRAVQDIMRQRRQI